MDTIGIYHIKKIAWQVQRRGQLVEPWPPEVRDGVFQLPVGLAAAASLPCDELHATLFGLLVALDRFHLPILVRFHLLFNFAKYLMMQRYTKILLDDTVVSNLK